MEHKTTDAQRKAIYKYDEKFERINCRFEKGTKEVIESLGYSVNAFIRLAVQEKVEREQNARHKTK